MHCSQNLESGVMPLWGRRGLRQGRRFAYKLKRRPVEEYYVPHQSLSSATFFPIFSCPSEYTHKRIFSPPTIVTMGANKVETEKDSAVQVEFADEKKLEQSTQGDYSGAVAKTDKAEIALVKKLDRRIMPALFVMYFLYV